MPAIALLSAVLSISAVVPENQPNAPIVIRNQPTSPDNGMVLLLILFVSSGVLLTALSVPLIFRKIPPNSWSGFRVRATLENEEVWYPANEYAGKRLFWVGYVTVVAAVALFLLPIPNVGIYASAVGGVVMVGLAAAVAQSFLYLRSLTERR